MKTDRNRMQAKNFNHPADRVQGSVVDPDPALVGPGHRSHRASARGHLQQEGSTTVLRLSVEVLRWHGLYPMRTKAADNVESRGICRRFPERGIPHSSRTDLLV